MILTLLLLLAFLCVPPFRRLVYGLIGLMIRGGVLIVGILFLMLLVKLSGG